MNYRILAFFSILILLSTTVLAEDYYTLVGFDAPASDVVTGANFAAYMAASFGIKFSGINDATNLDLENSMVVAIDEDHVMISANDDTDETYVDAASDYFLANDISVRVLDYDEVLPEDLFIKEDLVEEPVEEELMNEPIDEFICDGCEFNETCFPIGTTKDIDNLTNYCDGEQFRLQKGLGVDCLADYECQEICEGVCVIEQIEDVVEIIDPIVDEPESFFTKLFKKIFSWFG